MLPVVLERANFEFGTWFRSRMSVAGNFTAKSGAQLEGDHAQTIRYCRLVACRTTNCQPCEPLVQTWSTFM
jgi:hypothetical protein